MDVLTPARTPTSWWRSRPLTRASATPWPAPLAHLDPTRTSIVAPRGWTPPAAFAGHQRHTTALSRLAEFVRPRSVLAAGHYTAIGEAAFLLAEETGARYFVSQHGALTPFAPPLPRAAHLLAWTDTDAAFWTAGRA